MTIDTPPARRSAAEKISALQMLRALAATMVVILHVRYDFIHHLSLAGWLPDFLDAGNAGVDLFFVISGLVMVYSSEALFGRDRAAATFLVRRIARIVPLYWLMTVVMIVYVAARGFAASDASPTLAAVSFLFLPYARPSGDISPVFGVGWTLNFEMLFYAVFALALGASRAVTVACVTVVLAALALAGTLWPDLPMPLSYWSNPIVLEFAFGMMVALMHRRGVRLPAALAVLLGAAALAQFALFVGYGPPQVPRWLGYGVPAAELVAALTLANRDIAISWIDRIGDASYALYLCHPLVIAAARMLSLKGYLTPAVAPWTYLCGVVISSVGAALLLHRFVELPLTAGARRLLEAVIRPRRQLRARLP
jgi:exopolysaccharide production protein ExoZ